MLLRLFPRGFLRQLNIIPFVKHAYGLQSDEEFLKGYRESQGRYEGQWQTRTRATREDVEHFYTEHDGDIWRQAYLSRHDESYKRKMLWAYHALLRSDATKNDPVLDYGCGAGALCTLLSRKEYVGVEAADIPFSPLDFVRKEMASHLAGVHARGARTAPRRLPVTRRNVLHAQDGGSLSQAAVKTQEQFG